MSLLGLKNRIFQILQSQQSQSPFRHYAYGVKQRQANSLICMDRRVFLDPSAGTGIILHILPHPIRPSEVYLGWV
jgi:hypothetical protein